MQTILLVEDAPATLVACSLILRCFGYTVLEADSRGDAWRACHEQQGPIHLILMKVDLDDDGVGGGTKKGDVVADVHLISDDAGENFGIQILKVDWRRAENRLWEPGSLGSAGLAGWSSALTWIRATGHHGRLGFNRTVTCLPATGVPSEAQSVASVSSPILSRLIPSPEMAAPDVVEARLRGRFRRRS